MARCGRSGRETLGSLATATKRLSATSQRGCRRCSGPCRLAGLLSPWHAAARTAWCCLVTGRCGRSARAATAGLATVTPKRSGQRRQGSRLRWARCLSAEMQSRLPGPTRTALCCCRMALCARSATAATAGSATGRAPMWEQPCPRCRRPRGRCRSAGRSLRLRQADRTASCYCRTERSNASARGRTGSWATGPPSTSEARQ
mmetsp:Transcript_25920/g.97646  ORF Transcript_25920/g.97646 Transcript_25920/m.97646 type:complete len:202 (+) Transcript_25920:432-1037(+)